MRAIAKTLLLLIVVLLLAAAGGTGFAYYLNRPPDAADEPMLFTIDKGESVGAIAGRLQTNDLIRSAILLRLISKYFGTEAQFQSGTYRVAGMSALEMHDFLTSGNQVLLTVTIPEGYTAGRIAALLEEKGVANAREFEAAVTDRELLSDLGLPVSSAAGFLYPDTYRFPQDYPPERIVRHLVTRFFEVVQSIKPGYRSMSWDQLYDTVILASIVEREYRSAGEAPKIASVFYNRLEERMRLESCATVVYVMTEELGMDHPNRLFHRDLHRASPYNTYRNFGLPPGPISNPGRVSLAAAFHPADTDYRFFVLRGAGAREHHFSHTLSEHNEAALLYLKTP